MRHLTPTRLPQRTLTRLGRTIPALAAGCWPLAGPCANGGVAVGWAPIDDDTASRALRAAWQAGIRLFDTADVYGHGDGERRLGILVAEVPRDQILISSKTGYDARDGHPYEPHRMLRQLRASLTRLGTDHLDIYAFHSGNFGKEDEYLDAAVDQMRQFQREGLIRAISMRAPHEFAVEWATEPGTARGRSARRFLHLFDRIRPDVVAVRHNLLSPTYQPGETTIFDLARQHQVDVLIKQVLAQGLLVHHHGIGPLFGPGDHRQRRHWFSPLGRRIIWDKSEQIRTRFGRTPADLARVAIGYALATSHDTVALIGFRNAGQITTNTSLATSLTSEDIAVLAAAGHRIRTRLDEAFGTADA
ncbi:aldo/keto reductase [Micromonospora sp. NPDC050417]|uniref:aldo/keto reductase n=1 Tax=Micromonospora sp. NPDC050417 TaxID=3364280 RepID=UPI00378AF53F